MKFTSEFKELCSIEFPKWAGVRVQMMPIIMHEPMAVPRLVRKWRCALALLFSHVPKVKGIGYLTIDERFVEAGQYHRRPGLHVDGMGAWGSGGGGAWGKQGMLMASSEVGCAAWKQEFVGQPLSGTDPGDPQEGNCDHLRDQLLDDRRIILKPLTVYWCSAMCVHEALPVTRDCYRTFVRLSLPSSGAWPSNCTPNPLGVKPFGPITEPRRIDGVYGYR